MTCALPRGSMPSICPRRELMLPITSPIYSSGVTTSTAMTGSSRTGFALLDAGVHRRDVLARDRAADDLVLERVAGALLGRREVDDDVAELAAAAGLADEAPMHAVHGVPDGLAVGHLGAADVRVHPELAH